MFDLVVGICAICGVTMIVGGFLLLYRGKIKLAAATGGRAAATSVKFGKVLQIDTSVPAIGLFVIGLAFVLLALYFSNEERNASVGRLALTGIIMGADQGNDSMVSICFNPRIQTSSRLPFRHAIDYQSSWFEVQVSEAGYLPRLLTVAPASAHPPSSVILIKDGVAELGEVTLQKLVDKPAADIRVPVGAENSLAPPAYAY